MNLTIEQRCSMVVEPLSLEIYFSINQAAFRNKRANFLRVLSSLLFYRRITHRCQVIGLFKDVPLSPRNFISHCGVRKAEWRANNLPRKATEVHRVHSSAWFGIFNHFSVSMRIAFSRALLKSMGRSIIKK